MDCMAWGGRSSILFGSIRKAQLMTEFLMLVSGAYPIQVAVLSIKRLKEWSFE